MLMASGELNLYLKTFRGRKLYWTSGDVRRDRWTSVHFCINTRLTRSTVQLEARRGTAGPQGRNKLAVDDISLDNLPGGSDCLTQGTVILLFLTSIIEKL